MKLGILNACTPDEEAEFGDREFDQFMRLFAMAEHHLEFTEFRITEGEFPEVGQCDAYLITGSPKGAYENEPWILRLQNFIRDTHAQQTKLVGICFGHQVLAHSLGGQAEKSPKGWGFGLEEIEVAEPQAWMHPQIESGKFHFFHQDQVVKLPEGAERLAGNEFCPNGMFVLDDQVLGIQAHPEMSHEMIEFGIDWFRKTLPDVDKGVIDRAQANLEPGMGDGPVMAQWIVNFLQS